MIRLSGAEVNESNKEWNQLTKYNLTPDSPKWNPHTEVYGNQEHSMLNYQGNLVEKSERDRILFAVEQGYTKPESISC